MELAALVPSRENIKTESVFRVGRTPVCKARGGNQSVVGRDLPPSLRLSCLKMIDDLDQNMSVGGKFGFGYSICDHPKSSPLR